MAKRTYLKRTLRLVANDNCKFCEGTGVKATNEYERVSRKLVVTFEICECVRVKPIGLFLPPTTPDVTIKAS